MLLLAQTAAGKVLCYKDSKHSPNHIELIIKKLPLWVLHKMKSV